MAEQTGISWCDSTFNPWIGCTKVSPGCDHCYAEVSTPARTMAIQWGPKAERRRTSAQNWTMPVRWNAAAAVFAAAHGRRRRVFCASLADVFDNAVDPTWRADLFGLIASTPHLDWLILTKRIGNVTAMLPGDWRTGYRNVWLGISVVDQSEADRDVPKLLSVPAAIRWLSIEPMLGPIDCVPLLNRVDWVVVGGESGPHARPMNREWAISLQAQCEVLCVPFFFKQWGGDARDKGGSLLDGRERKAWPKPPAETLPCRPARPDLPKMFEYEEKP